MNVPHTDATIRCLVLGDANHAEMAGVADFLTAEDVLTTEDPATADLVVVCLTDPDAHSLRSVSETLARSPLARLVVAESSYCESIGRTREHWPLATLVAARNVADRLTAERAVLSGTRLPLPLTASRDESWAFDHETHASPPTRAVPVRVESPDRELARCWSDQLRDASFEVTSADEDPFDGVLVLDGDPWNDQLRGRVVARSRALLPTVVLMTMPPAPSELQAEHVAVVPKLAPSGVLVSAVRRAGERLDYSG